MSSVFDNKAAQPDDAALAAALGATKPLWDGLLRRLEALDGVDVEWKFYGKKHGWQVKAIWKKKKALVYLIPHADSFLAGLGLSDRAVEVLLTSDLPSALVTAIAEAPSFPEGHPARVEVTDAGEANIVERLLDIKLAA